MDWVDDTVFSIKLSIDIFSGISLNLGVGGVGVKDPVGTADCLTLITSLIRIFSLHSGGMSSLGNPHRPSTQTEPILRKYMCPLTSKHM